MPIIEDAWKAVRTTRMRLGNIYVWMVLGSFVLAFFGGSSLSSHRSHRDAGEVTDDYDASDDHSPFVEGFDTAFVLVGFWGFLYLNYEMRHPRFRGKLRGQVMDYESGRLVMPSVCIAEGHKWPWVACVRETKSGRMATVELEARIPRRHDLDYDEDVHIVPYKLTEDRDCYGRHEFTRDCCCHPEVMEQVNGRTFVWHSENREIIG